MDVIFRNPCITEKDKLEGMILACKAVTIIEEATDLAKEDLLKSMELTLESVQCMEQAAKCMGFLCYTDMQKYLEIHGTLD